MIRWLRQRKMAGGVVFGASAWMPGRVENTFDGKEDAETSPARELAEEAPHDRKAFAAWLATFGLEQTSAITPPLREQVEALGESPTRTLVLNLLPTQPEFALAGALSRLAIEDVRAGLETVQRAIKARRVMVVLDQHDRQARRIWRWSAKGRGIEVVSLLNKYPQGHPTILMRSLFGKRLEPGMPPARAHRVIVDPVACWGIGLRLRTGQPFTERPVQVFLEEARAARLVMGHIGETISAFCARLGLEPPAKRWASTQVIVNGMLAGVQVDPVTRIETSTESVTLRQRVEAETPSACLACGWCVDICPTGLTPVHLMELAQGIPDEANEEAGLPERKSDAAKKLRQRNARESLHCIGCGLCSYVCPTRLPLTQETVRLRLRVLAASSRGAAPPPGHLQKEEGK